MIKEYLVPALVLGATVACVTTGFVAYDKGWDAQTLVSDAKIAKANKAHAEEKTKLLEAQGIVSDAHVREMNTLDKKYLEQRENDKAKSDAKLAAYRSNELRLRDDLARRVIPACNGTETTSGTGSGHEAQSVGLRDQDVEFLVHLADDADQVADALRACQGVVTSYETMYRKSWPEAVRLGGK